MNERADPYEFQNGEPMHDDGASVNLPAEEAILGALLTNNLALSAIPFLEAEHFAHPLNQEIFAAIQAKSDANRVADPVTLMRQFRDRTIGEMSGGQYMASLVSNSLPAAMARDYAICVLEAYAIRRAVEAADDFSQKLLTKRPDQMVTEIVAELEDELTCIRGLAPKGDSRTSISAYLDGFLAKLSDQDKAARVTIPFPLPEIGTILQEDGFEPGNLYGLVAASGEGKTSLTLQIMRAAAEAGHPVLLMSFDQTGEQVARQMASQATGIGLGQMRRKGGMGDAEWSMIDREQHKLRTLPLEIKKLRQEKIGRICGQAQSFAKRWSTRTDKAPLIILDHNRKVTPDRPNDHEGRIAASINGAGKALAEEIGAAVLFLCQRNGGGLKRDVPRPIAADLFGGESAREDFDAILYLYRAEHWQNEKLKVAGSASEEDKIRARFRIGGEDPEGKAELGALKVRYGRSDVREIVNWIGRYTRYETRMTGAGRLV